MPPQRRRRPDGLPAVVPEWIKPDRDGLYRVNYKLANWLLERNIGNRAIRWADVEKYRGDMLAGKWEDRVDPIYVDTEVMMLSGQHRALAVANRSRDMADQGDLGISFRVRIEWDMPREAARVLDTGIKRNLADYLKLREEGDGHPSEFAQVIKNCWAWQGRHFLMTGFKVASNDTLLMWLDQNSGVRIHWQEAWPLTKGTAKIPIGVGGAFAYAAWCVAPMHQWEFIEGIARGDKNHHGVQDPRWRLREWTINLQIQRRDKERARPQERLFMLVKAWNYWLEDRPLPKLVHRQGERFPDMLGMDEQGNLIDHAW
jgi:hypothetical protein